jgi:hypothetical protein
MHLTVPRGAPGVVVRLELFFCDFVLVTEGLSFFDSTWRAVTLISTALPVHSCQSFQRNTVTVPLLNAFLYNSCMMLSGLAARILAACVLIAQMATGFVIRASPATQNRELQQKRTRRPRLPKLAPVPHTRDTRQSPKTIVQSLDPDAVYVSARLRA